MLHSIKDYLHKHCIYFEDLLPYIISELHCSQLRSSCVCHIITDCRRFTKYEVGAASNDICSYQIL